MAAQKLTQTVIETAIKGGGGIVQTLKKSYSMNDLNNLGEEELKKVSHQLGGRWRQGWGGGLGHQKGDGAYGRGGGLGHQPGDSATDGEGSLGLQSGNGSRDGDELLITSREMAPGVGGGELAHQPGDSAMGPEGMFVKTKISLETRGRKRDLCTVHIRTVDFT